MRVYNGPPDMKLLAGLGGAALWPLSAAMAARSSSGRSGSISGAAAMADESSV